MYQIKKQSINEAKVINNGQWSCLNNKLFAIHRALNSSPLYQIMFSFVSIETFNNILNEYIDSLPSNRQAKALITQELADKVKRILLDEEPTSDRNLRYWSRKHFSTLEINNTIQLVDKTSLKVVCLKNDVIGRLHQELQHAGYHKTYNAVVKLVLMSIIIQLTTNIACYSTKIR